MNINQLYHTYLSQLNWKEKLELAELLMQSTIESIKQKNQARPQQNDKDPEYTPLQNKLLNGPVMANEDYELYLEKKKHFDKWK
ncbi:hypothetical protein [Phaeodactylibacter xiamenensis]|jgi:hypothetical protein|uniref:hypothetical protein n=1 Tax=Phaeodactylibacter xiamenensis TaxID=1524460 RepID=UPI003BAB2002